MGIFNGYYYRRMKNSGHAGADKGKDQEAQGPAREHYGRNPYKKSPFPGQFNGISAGAASPGKAQRKIAIGSVNSKYEAEADNVAEKVTSGKAAGGPAKGPGGGTVQRSESPITPVQRMGGEEEGAAKVQREEEEAAAMVQREEEEAAAPMVQREEEEAAAMVQREEEEAAAPMVQREEEEAAAMVQREEEEAAAPMVQREEEEAAAMVQREEEEAAAPMVQREEEEAAAMVQREEEEAAAMVQREEEEAAAPMVQREEEEAAAMVQREEEEAATPMVQREEEEAAAMVQRRPAQLPKRPKRPKTFNKISAPRGFESRVKSTRGRGETLPTGLRKYMEQSIGADFRKVRIHKDAESVKLNRAIHAQAFTLGNDIYFNAGKFNPDTPSGQFLLAHELTHVVQQKGRKG